MADDAHRIQARAMTLAAALLGLAACGSSPADVANGTAAAGPSRSAAASPPAAATVKTAPVAVGAAAAGPATARRCGWLHNPTPGNWWLTDREGEWVLAAQGGEQAPGLDDMPDMTTAGWAEVNGHYGYGCACATIAGDPATRKVERVSRFEPKPLRLCRSDPDLPKP